MIRIKDVKTNPAPMPPVKITSGALADYGEGDIILRGVIDASSLASLLVDDYQREVQGRKHIRGIMGGIPGRGSVPDIELGMRGHSFIEAGDAFFLQDPVYIIDGLQRTTAALEVLKTGVQPRIGAMIHFDTTRAWEKQRFEVLNTKRAPVNANILIHNLADENKAIQLMMQLSKSSIFALSNRVCWRQKMKRNELVHAQTMLKTVCLLHSRWMGRSSPNATKMAETLEKRVYNEIGQQMLWQNMKMFFDLIDKCWGIQTIQYSNSAAFMKAGFLKVLARVLADHQDFWNKNELVVSTDLRRKISLFPIHDNTVVYLAGAAGKAQVQLYHLFVDHINSGKRTRRLTPFENLALPAAEDEDESELAAVA